MLFPSFARSSSYFFATFLCRPTTLGIAFLVALVAACPRVAAQTTAPQPRSYTITDLGILPGGYFIGPNNSKCYCSYGFGINAAGQVAGFASGLITISRYGTTVLTPEAVIFSAGGVKGLGFVPNPTGDLYAQFSAGMAINGFGEVTGSGNAVDPYENDAFLYSAGNMNDLGRLNGDDDDAVGNAINDAGQIVGWSTKDNPNGGPPRTEAFLYSNGAMENLGTLPGGTGGADGFGEITYAYSINASGQAVGSALVITGPYNGADTYAVLFDGGKVINLGVPNGARGSAANAINDLGVIAGTSYFADGTTHAFSYSKGEFTDLGTLPGLACFASESINISGQIVGTAEQPGPCVGLNTTSFLHTPGQGMIDVNSLAPKNSGWTDLGAVAINDKGQITGTGTNPEGFQRAFLLSPVFTQFSTLDAVVDITKTTFTVGGRFTLGAKSDGIDLLKETAVLQLGGYHIALPPSSFVEKNGIYTYNGKIGNVTLEVVGRQVGKNVYLFGVLGQGATGLPTSYPLDLVLTIGNDTGSEEIKANYAAGQRSQAEVCRNLGLTCAN